MYKLIFTLFLSLAIIACNSDQPPSSSQAENTAPNTPAAPSAPAPSAPAISLPSLPIEMAQTLWNQCDYVDYVFYYTNFSMSQKEKASIQASIRHISGDVAPVKPECQPIGRIFYQIDGENYLEADLHLTEGCAFLLFYKDGKKSYANKITQEGLQFYQNVFNQTQQAQPGQ